jgi:glycosyltransferase involved in cell wall biosynthesis
MVGISLLTLVPGVVGGSETYARELVCALARVGELEYVVFTSRVLDEAYFPDLTPGSERGSRLQIRQIGSYPSARTMPGRAAAMTRAVLLPGPIRRELGLERLAAIHFPLTAMLPLVDHPAAVTTMHDLQHEVYPRFFSRAELAYRRVVYRRTARASHLVVAPSEYVKGTLVERLGLAPERVRVVYHGIDHARFAPAELERQPFLLYPANRWPHKNHDRLFEALALLRRRRTGLRLVLTGSGHDGKRAPDGVEVRGRVTSEELAGLYRTAAALVFPSLYEGFGAPPLEAMACACPVAASDVCSIPELVGDAAALFDPRSAEAIADGVERALDDRSLVPRGLARAAEFTWEACAREHEGVYRDAVTTSSGRASRA